MMNEANISVIHWDDEGSAHPMLRTTIEGIPVKLLLDTGCTFSALDETYLKKHSKLSRFVLKSSVQISVNTIGLTDSTVCEKSLFTEFLLVGEKMYTQEFFKLNLWRDPVEERLRYDGILGFDFFRKNKCILNFDNNSLTVANPMF